MSLKAKIIKKLKEKAKSLGINLSNVRINGLADKLDAIVDNEDDIDGEIDKLDSIVPFKELAALDDAKRNADRLQAEREDKSDEPDETDKPEKTDTVKPKASDKTEKDEVPAWAQSLIETNKALQAELITLKTGQVSQTRRQQLEAKLKDAPEKFKARTLRDFDRLKIDSDEDFTNYLADIEQDVADEIQAAADAGLGIDAPTGGSGGSKLKDDEVSPEMKLIIEQRKAEASAKANA